MLTQAHAHPATCDATGAPDALKNAVLRATKSALPRSMAAAAAETAATVLQGVQQSTLAAYAKGFADYEHFCGKHRTQTLPAAPAVLSTYLVQRMNNRGTFGAVSAAVAAIGFAHRACGFGPVHDGQWKLVLAAARAKYAKAVARRQELTPAMLRQVIDYTLHRGRPDSQQAKRGLCIALGYLAGARFSDLDRSLISDFHFDKHGVLITPTGRRKNDGTLKKSAHRRNLFAARVGGRTCIVEAIERCIAKFDWQPHEKIMPANYDSYLRQYRGIVRRACGLTAEQAAKFGTHSGRRGAAATSQSSGDAPTALRSFAGVTSDSWSTWYADSLVPEERAAVASTLANAVANTVTQHEARRPRKRRRAGC